jgi:hypothetical protein
MGGIELKELFLDKLKAFKKAMDYMDGPVNTADKVKWQPRFCTMLAELNGLEYQFRESACCMSDEEIWSLMDRL